MSTENRLSVTLLAPDKAAALACATTLRTKLPFLLSLVPEERRRLPTIKDGNTAFHDKCAAYITAHPELLPSYVSLPEYQKDRPVFNDLTEIRQAYAPILQDIEDTLAQLGHELYLADLAFYQNVRQAAKAGVPGAKAIYDDLKERFAGQGKPNPPTPPPAT